MGVAGSSGGDRHTAEKWTARSPLVESSSTSGLCAWCPLVSRCRVYASMATTRQTQAARQNVKKAQSAAKSGRSIAHMSKAKRSALGKQAAAVAQRKRTGGASPKTRAELYELAKQRDLPGRSKMGRAELAKALGEQ